MLQYVLLMFLFIDSTFSSLPDVCMGAWNLWKAHLIPSKWSFYSKLPIATTLSDCLRVILFLYHYCLTFYLSRFLSCERSLFVHYRPDADPQWFTRPNEPNTPAQVLSIDHCKKNEEGILDCDGVQLPFLSPSNEVVRGSSDLFSYWERIGQAENARAAADTAASGHQGDEL